MAVKMPVAPTVATSETQNETTIQITNATNGTVGTVRDSRGSTNIRMPFVPEVTNPDPHTISGTTNLTTAIRIDDNVGIDDSGVGTRKTWSSAKILEYVQANGAQIVYQYVANYGELYFSEYNETVYNEWTQVIEDAIVALNNGEPFYVAWSEKQPAQVVNADLDSEPRMTVIIDGRTYAMSDTGIVEVPIYNIVIQCANRDSFPEVGTPDRLYIDIENDAMYYWRNEYKQLTGKQEPLHKLTFGAGEEYVYDGSEDVTVPVYLGAVT